MRYLIENKEGKKLHLEASDWMMAMVRATAAFGASPTGFDCERRSESEVYVTDPRSGDWWRVIADPDLQASLDLPEEDTILEPLVRGSQMPARPRRYRSPLRKPLWSPESTPTSRGVVGASPPPPNLAERLYELAAEIRSQPDGYAAAAHTLRLACGFANWEAGSVLRATEEGDDFEFFVVQGGAGESLVGRRVPLGQGIVGASFSAGVTIRVEDVASDPRHMREIDQDTGFETRSLLCVPIRSSEGFHGAVELLNAPPGKLHQWHVDVVESLTLALAEALAARSS